MKTPFKTLAVLSILLIQISCTKQNLNTPSARSTSSSHENVVTALHIGQSYGGGIIFYIDSTGQHGLIVSSVDIATTAWWNGSYVQTRATGKGIGTGARNTQKIINVQGSSGNYAALLCTQYRGGNFSDWYLPSKNELNALYKKRAKVGNIGTNYYWTSTESNDFDSYYQYFLDGTSNLTFKNQQLTVRAVRSF